MEPITMSEMESKFGKKSTANTALGFGIAGTALGVLNGGLGGLFGGNNANSGICAVPSLWEVCEKQNAENVALTAAIYQGRIKEIEDLNNVYQAVNTRLVELEKKDAALTASLPLAMQLAQCNSERFTEHLVNREREHQSAINYALQSEIMMRPKGQVGLPFSEIITGIPGLPPVQYCVTGCNCPSK